MAEDVEDRGFNPLAGIRCFLTLQKYSDDPIELKGFNPLAGIRCFLTYIGGNAGRHRYRVFQSPSGDSLFSDIF